MMKVDRTNVELIFSAITSFVGEPVVDVVPLEDDGIAFVTQTGATGSMVRNPAGNWDICIEEEVVYEMENELYEVIEAKKSGQNLIKIYKHIRDEVDWNGLKFKSKKFLRIIYDSVGKIIFDGNMPLEGSVQMDEFFVFYTKAGIRFRVCLN